MHPTTQIAENHTLISRALFNEGMRAVENKSYKKTVQKLALILLAIYLAAAAWLLCTGGSLIFLIGETIFLGALLFWLSIMLPSTKRRSKYKAMAVNGLPTRETRFYPDHLTVLSDTGKETTLFYHDMVSHQETKHLYILTFQNNVNVMLDKKGFVSGDLSAILQSLH